MSLFISVSANHRDIEKIKTKAKSLKSAITSELSWDNGFVYDDKSKLNIFVFEHSEDLYNYILELEPLVDRNDRKRKSGGLVLPSALETLNIAYPDPVGEKK